MGLMLTKDGVKILNFKCQFGDPQCQVSDRHTENLNVLPSLTLTVTSHVLGNLHNIFGFLSSFPSTPRSE